MPRLSDQERAMAIGLLEAGTPVKGVAQMMGVSPNAILQQRATRLVNTVRRQCQEVIDKRAGYTHY